MPWRNVTMVATAAVFLFGGCQKQVPEGSSNVASTATPASTETKDGKGGGTAGSGATEKTSAPQPIARASAPAQLAGAHILIAYKGAMRARPNVTRSKEEALTLARELAAKAKKDPELFAELAKKSSDGPSGPRGGDLGVWHKGQMVPAFDQAIEKLEIGQVSDPVETPFGYHVMKRNPLPPTFAGSHILIAYKGAMRARPNVTRSKEEALALARDLAGQARKAPDKFAELAKQHSDGPSGPRGGSLGSWRKGRMVPAFDQAIEKLEIGQVCEPVETPFGYHVIKREAPPEH